METTIYNSEQLFAKSVGTHLSEILSIRRIPVQDFAISVNVHYNQMTGYLRGEHAPKWDILIRMCNHLNIHIDQLMPVSHQHHPLLVTDSGQISYVPDYSFQKQLTMKQVKNVPHPEPEEAVSAEETKKPTVNELSGLFARRIVKLYQFLTEQQVPHEYNMSRNALLTGTSIGSLLLKTDYPQSRDEYFQYVSRALDQARECQYWINLLHDSQYLSEEQFTSVQDDLKSILNILWAIIRSRKKTALPSNNQRLNPE